MREHAEAVREAGHRVVVVHLAGSSPDLGRSLWAMEQELDSRLTEGIETYHVCHRRVPVRGGSYPLYLWSAFSAHRRLRDAGFRPEIIHAHVYGAGVPAAIIAGRTRVPLVITEHFSGVALRSLGRVEARKARFAYSRAARILPVSQFLQDAIRSYDVHRPFEVVPNVVDSSVFFPPAEGSRPDSVRRLLFVGNLEPMHLKGFPTLLRALLLLREQRQDWRLDVIGDGPERERHEKSAVELDLGGYVTFHALAPSLRSRRRCGLPISCSCRAPSRRSAQLSPRRWFRGYPWFRRTWAGSPSSSRNATVGSFPQKTLPRSPKPSQKPSRIWTSSTAWQSQPRQAIGTAAKSWESA